MVHRAVQALHDIAHPECVGIKSLLFTSSMQSTVFPMACVGQTIPQQMLSVWSFPHEPPCWQIMS